MLKINVSIQAFKFVALCCSVACLTACVNPTRTAFEKRKFVMPSEQIVGPPSVILPGRKDFMIGSVDYMDGNVYGNGFKNVQLTIQRNGSAAEFTMRYATSSGGWHTQNPREPFEVTVELLNADKAVLDQFSLGRVNIPCSPSYNNVLKTVAPRVGAYFDKIAFVRIRPDLWLQTIDSC